MLDTDFVRSAFPALDDEWALFDNAGGSVPLRGVIDRVRDYMTRRQVQLGASYLHSHEAAGMVEAGRSAMARLVGAAPDEIVLGPSTTANAKTLARALAPGLRPGDEVVVTDLDHEANVGPWRALTAQGVAVREWRVNRDTLALELDDLAPLLGDRTRLVCFTHASNLIGTIHDAAAINRVVHEAGALSVIDGVAYAPHRRVDVRALDADFYLLSLYKTYGPHLGLLCGKRDLLAGAAGQNHFFVGEDEVPYKMEPGGVVHELVASLPAIPEYLLALDSHHHPGGDADEDARLDSAFDAIAAHEEAIAAPLLDFLRSRPEVRIHGHPRADRALRAPTISFTVGDRDSSEIPPLLDAKRIAVRFGHFYAHRAVSALGLHGQNGVVRVSMVHYNTVSETERLVRALDQVL